MTKVFDTYCSDVGELEIARDKLDAALCVQCVLHESDYWGGVYYSAASAEFGRIAVRYNWNRYADEHNVPECPECVVVVTVSYAPNYLDAERRLAAAGFRLVRRVAL